MHLNHLQMSVVLLNDLDTGLVVLELDLVTGKGSSSAIRYRISSTCMLILYIRRWVRRISRLTLIAVYMRSADST
jgi:hypothetical protein